MVFVLDDYERVAERVAVADIDFDSFRKAPLKPRVLRCVRYMHDVEQHTSCYLRNLLNIKAHLDPEISTFLTLWGYQELWHGDALGRVLVAHGEPAGAARVGVMRERLGWRLTAAPLAWMALSAVTAEFLAVHMSFGVINEWTTQAGYARLSAIADHPVLRELLRRIMRQEGQHIDFYGSQARARLEASRRAQRTTRVLLRTAWHPVGAKVMPIGETRHLVRTLFTDDDGRAVAKRVDRRIDTLPGQTGLCLMAGALTRYGSRDAPRVYQPRLSKLSAYALRP